LACVFGLASGEEVAPAAEEPPGVEDVELVLPCARQTLCAATINSNTMVHKSNRPAAARIGRLGGLPSLRRRDLVEEAVFLLDTNASATDKLQEAYQSSTGMLSRPI
jgi:hypothetical protein